jgi:WhiB family redox-sensing transcriptional regulator
MAEISRLPGPVADLWEWQLAGVCRTADPTLFFHPEGERGPLDVTGTSPLKRSAPDAR